MSIRLRLLISYLAMLLIPLILFPLSALALAHFYIGDIQQFYNFDFRHHSIKQEITKETLVIQEIRNTAAENPDKLLDINYLKQLDSKLRISKSGLVLRKDGQLIYVAELFDKTEIREELRHFEYFPAFEREPQPYLDKDSRLSAQQFDFYFRDQHPGTIFIITDIGPIRGFVEKFFSSLLAAALLILIATSGLLTYYVSRSIIRSIESLKQGAMQIKEGNLDFTIASSSQDELGQLCNAFEEMRQQLKSSIESKLQYEENRKELIANISHDLKTPVTAIKGYTEGIMDGVADSPEKMSKYIMTIHNKAIDIDRLIDELFIFSKLDLGKEPFNFAKVDMLSYLQNIATDLQFDLDKINISLDFVLPENRDPLMVILDREKIKRVILNVIGNAIKYIQRSEGKVILGLEDGQQFVRLVIKDNGPGISHQALPFIFDRFYRADPSRNSATGGSGLGLAIAKRIVEEHGGQMWAESTEGKGTTIFFTLKKAEV